MAEHLLNLGITSGILHLSAFCTQIWAGQSSFVPSFWLDMGLEITKATPEIKDKEENKVKLVGINISMILWHYNYTIPHISLNAKRTIDHSEVSEGKHLKNKSKC